MPRSTPYFRHLSTLIHTKGNREEQELLAQWQAPLQEFFDLHKRGLADKAQALELGIEDRLGLKLNIKAARGAPIAPMLTAYLDHPVLAPWANLILTHSLRFHSGIKITSETCSHELYIYATPEQIASILGATHPVTITAQDTQAGFIGVDDTHGYSIYFHAPSARFSDEIAKEIRQPFSDDIHWLWQQARFSAGAMIPGKVAFEVKPMRLPLMMRLLTHYPFPWFRYLFPKRDLANGNFGRDIVTGRFTFYGSVSIMG